MALVTEWVPRYRLAPRIGRDRGMVEDTLRRHVFDLLQHPRPELLIPYQKKTPLSKKKTRRRFDFDNCVASQSPNLFASSLVEEKGRGILDAMSFR